MGLETFLLMNTLSGRIAENRRQLLTAQRRRFRRTDDGDAERDARLAALEDDLGYVTLVLGALLCRLEQQGSVTQDEVRSLVAELDDVDGVRDGRLDVNLLKELTSD